MALSAWLDEFGKTGWIVLMIAGFLLFWPIGLAVLGFLICSGRLRAWWFGPATPAYWPQHSREGDFWRGPFGQPAFRNGPLAGDRRPEATAGRQEEQRDFQDYLQRLRRAKDRRRPTGS